MNHKRVIHLIIFAYLIVFAFPATAQRNLMDGKIFLSYDSVIITNDSLRIEIPVKHKPVRIVANPYTAKQKVRDKIEPEKIDSVTLWNPTAPERSHTFEYIPPYGWSWLLERGNHISVYAFSPKGYTISGNGGIWARNKLDVIVRKGDKTYLFSKPGKYADNKFRKQVAEIVNDDPGLVRMIMQASSRRDKILRMLSLYSPNK